MAEDPPEKARTTSEEVSVLKPVPAWAYRLNEYGAWLLGASFTLVFAAYALWPGALAFGLLLVGTVLFVPGFLLYTVQVSEAP